MTVSSETSSISYAGNGTTVAFAFPYLFFEDADLAVLQVAADGTITPLVLNVGYTVDGAGLAIGGTVTTTTAPAAGTTLTILRDPALLQESQFVSTQPFPSETVERGYDYVTMLCQRLAQQVKAAIHYPDGETNTDATLGSVAARKGTYLFFDAVTGAISYAVNLAVQTLTQAVFNAFYFLTDDHKRTAAELSAGVTPTAYQYAPGHRARYASLSNAVAVSATHPLMIYDDETVTAAITVPTNAQIYGVGRPQITNSTAGERIFQADSVANVIIDGVRFKGANSSSAPNGTLGGYPATSTGIVAFTSSTDIRITNCEADTFYNGFAVVNCQRVWITRNRITHWLVYGVLASISKEFTIDHNDIVGCDQAGAANAYAVSATGDSNGANIQLRNSISFNTIGDIPSWDGIMSHDCSGLRIVGNDIRNVRTGVDITSSASTNAINDILVSLNYIESTATDTWAAAAALHAGIICQGFDATHLLARLVITNNIVRNFFTTAGMTGSGNNSNITISYTSRAVVNGNLVQGSGTVISNAGIFVVANNDSVAINGNNLQGSMAAGAIRFATVTADAASVCGNTITQVTPANTAFNITSSTLTALAWEGNATNSTGPLAQSGSTITWSDSYLRGSATYDPPNLADGAGATTNIALTGAALGSFVVGVSFSLDLQGITVTAYVSAANNVAIRFQNESGGALDLASGTLSVLVRKF